MTISLYWAKIIPDPSLRWAGRVVFALLLTATVFGGSILGAGRGAGSSKPARPAEAGNHAPPGSDLALLEAGISEQARKDPASAIRDLRAVRPRLPALADYIGYSLAAAEYDLGDFNAALHDVEAVWRNTPRSPLTGDAALVAARAYRETSQPAASVRVLRENYLQLAQPAGDALLAACYRASGDLAAAAVYYQRVYYQHPLSPEAAEAAQALGEIKTTLGGLYPPAGAEAMFERAGKLASAGEYSRARAEYESMSAALAGADLDLVRVRLGALSYLSSQTAEAFRYLRSLEVPSPAADAERLYYLVQCARRLDRDEEVMSAVTQLERYPTSPWRLKALVSAANSYLLDNGGERYLPLYRACYESFAGPRADYCHWKVAWYAYLHRERETAALLREHLLKFPSSDHAPAALYFLGRLSEDAKEFGDAKAYYSEIGTHYPNAYYGDLADERELEPALFRATESPEVREFLSGVTWPVQPARREFEPSPATQARIERARLLNEAGLEELAEAELRFGARTEDQPEVLAIRLAQVANKYTPPHQALRLVKSLVPDYLSIPIDEAPPGFWRLLYPLPWRTELERNARLQGLDPFLVAGLIRQESEFNPDAISPAHACGLTQILPSTGRRLLKVSRRRFRRSLLFRPEVNLRLGTTYLRHMYDLNSGRTELTLAAYNAGNSRVQSWLSWGDFREPAEFIETIPFSETRIYVQAVLRNASMYRKLYGPDGPGPLAADNLPPPARRPALSSGAKKKLSRHKTVHSKRSPARRTRKK
jgi:soluble lytic murein transglycosylase